MKLYQNHNNHHQIVAIRWNGQVKTFTNNFPMISKKYTKEELRQIKYHKHLIHLRNQRKYEQWQQKVTPVDKAGLKTVSAIMKQHPTITDMGWNGRFLNYKPNNSIYEFGQSNPQQTKRMKAKESKIAYHQYINDKSIHYYRVTKYHDLVLYGNTFTKIAHIGDYIVMDTNELDDIWNAPKLTVYNSKDFYKKYQIVKPHSIPKHLYVITQDTGEYSDRSVTVVRVVNNVLTAYKITKHLNHKYGDDFYYHMISTIHNHVEE